MSSSRTAVTRAPERGLEARITARTYLRPRRIQELDALGRRAVCSLSVPRQSASANQARTTKARKPRYSAESGPMELGGLEPPTSWVRSKALSA